MIEITATEDEWRAWGYVGIMRNVFAILRGTNQLDGAPPQGAPQSWFWNINGASGEGAVAKWLKVPWDGSFENFKAKDVGGLVDVRTTPGHNYPLRLHPGDDNDRPFILVTGKGPSWRIQGWLNAGDGKQEKWWSDRPPPACVSTGMPAYWVPQEHIHKNLDDVYEWFQRKYEQNRTRQA